MTRKLLALAAPTAALALAGTATAAAGNGADRHQDDAVRSRLLRHEPDDRHHALVRVRRDLQSFTRTSTSTTC